MDEINKIADMIGDFVDDLVEKGEDLVEKLTGDDSNEEKKDSNEKEDDVIEKGADFIEKLTEDDSNEEKKDSNEKEDDVIEKGADFIEKLTEDDSNEEKKDSNEKEEDDVFQKGVSLLKVGQSLTEADLDEKDVIEKGKDLLDASKSFTGESNEKEEGIIDKVEDLIEAGKNLFTNFLGSESNEEKEDSNEKVQTKMVELPPMLVKQVRPSSSNSTRPMSGSSISVIKTSLNCLVTGGSGFIAMHLVELLLKEGHNVTATVRSLHNEEKTEPLRQITEDPEHQKNLNLVEADLCDAECWETVVRGMDIVFHVASPFPLAPPEDEQECLKPAVQGTLNVLKACQKDNVKRVVLTSCADAMFGELSDAESRLYSESDWPNEENINDPYTKSKLLAEQAAWSFVEDQIRAGRSCFELAVINPTFVLGPPLSPNECTSMAIFMMSFNNDQPQDDQVLPDMLIPVCDVRDVALAHYRAATLPEASGNRHLITSESEWISLGRLREVLAEEFNPQGMNIATGPMGELREVSPSSHNRRMVEVLKITPTPLNKTIIDMGLVAYDLLQLDS